MRMRSSACGAYADADDLGALVVDSVGIEVIHSDVRVWAYRVSHRSAVLGELPLPLRQHTSAYVSVRVRAYLVSHRSAVLGEQTLPRQHMNA